MSVFVACAAPRFMTPLEKCETFVWVIWNMVTGLWHSCVIRSIFRHTGESKHLCDQALPVLEGQTSARVVLKGVCGALRVAGFTFQYDLCLCWDCVLSHLLGPCYEDLFVWLPEAWKQFFFFGSFCSTGALPYLAMAWVSFSGYLHVAKVLSSVIER